MKLCGISAIRFRMVERSRLQTFAARLLPEPLLVTDRLSPPDPSLSSLGVL
jgi:hypothetical protein